MKINLHLGFYTKEITSETTQKLLDDISLYSLKNYFQDINIQRLDDFQILKSTPKII